MNFKHHKSLHYVLIILLMFAPLRSVFAMQLMGCDMQTPLSEVVSSIMPMATSTGHCQHMNEQVSAERVVNQSKHLVKSCCNGDAPCNSSCHFAISASLFIQRAEFSPALFNTDIFAIISSALLVRELSPPSRPPLPLHS